jgi:hypothetical protein
MVWGGNCVRRGNVHFPPRGGRAAKTYAGRLILPFFDEAPERAPRTPPGRSPLELRPARALS